MGLLDVTMGWTSYAFTHENPSVATLGKRRIRYENINNYSITANSDDNGRTELSKYERRRHAENDAADAENAVLYAKY
jgi:hypothetical protein